MRRLRRLAAQRPPLIVDLPKPPFIVVDVLNQCVPTFQKNESIHAWLGKTAQRMAALRCWFEQTRQLTAVGVVDYYAQWKASEFNTKWVERRAREMKTGVHRIPLNADTLACELLMRCGIPLINDDQNDGEDVIASLALNDEFSKVLSNDGDYVRYDDGALRERVVTWDGHRGIHRFFRKEIQEPLVSIPNYNPVFVTEAAALVRGKLDTPGQDNALRHFVRGNTYPLAEINGHASLHVAARPFRRALYKTPVRERFPIWDGTVQWVDVVVDPSTSSEDGAASLLAGGSANVASTYDFLLDGVGGAYDSRHAETVLLYACELAAHANNSSILQELELHTGQVVPVPPKAPVDQPSKTPIYQT